MRQKQILPKLLKLALGGAALAVIPVIVPASAGFDARAGIFTAVLIWLALGRMLPNK